MINPCLVATCAKGIHCQDKSSQTLNRNSIFTTGSAVENDMIFHLEEDTASCASESSSNRQIQGLPPTALGTRIIHDKAQKFYVSRQVESIPLFRSHTINRIIYENRFRKRDNQLILLH